MYTLGLHGGNFRTHDASACLLKDGEIVAFAEEERFIRNKRAFDTPPINATKYCLESANICVNDVDQIAIGLSYNPNKNPDVNKFRSGILPESIFGQINNIKTTLFDHHYCHALSTYYCSGYESAAILVIDGEGSGMATSIFTAKKNTVKLIKNYPVNYSLGYLYATFSKYLGFGSFGAGKLMGLSSYGEPIYVDLIERVYTSINKIEFDLNHDSQEQYIEIANNILNNSSLTPPVFDIIFDSNKKRVIKMPKLNQQHKDLASSIQKFIEKKINELITEAIQITKEKQICLAGGVALNCLSNSKVGARSDVEGLFIQPACEDSGVSLGAALAVTGNRTIYKGPWLGPEFNDDSIKSILDELKINYIKVSDPTEEAADLLVKGKIIGWFQGKMETGPRALGFRSILSSPVGLNTKDIVNKIKHREKWRPFGPSVLAEKCVEIFENYSHSPFMLMSFTVKPNWREKIPAVIHIDGTSRPQAVTREYNQQYYRLIKKFYKMTGIPMVLNTSFNDAGEPIVCTPLDAIRTFYTTELDALIMGKYLIKKGKNE